VEVKDIDDKKYLFGMLLVIGNRLQTIGDEFYEEITCKQWFILVGISLFEEEPPTINEITDAIGSSHQNIKQIVQKLENAGFVKMYRDENDRRKIRVKLTSKCEEFSKKYQKKEDEFLDSLFEGIDQESFSITLNTMRKLEENIIKKKG
jgi:DNA-binding MarR family transcriptional regulator